MDKQHLAGKIWQTATNLRGNIEAYTYKDYILGLLFYKFITDKQYELMSKDMGMDDESIYAITENDRDLVEYCRKNLGYFVEPKHFYKYWIQNLREFFEEDLSVSLNAFEKNIGPDKKHVFSGIFDTLTRNLSALAPSSSARTKALTELLIILKNIPPPIPAMMSWAMSMNTSYPTSQPQQGRRVGNSLPRQKYQLA